jgi:hypothetical protein
MRGELRSLVAPSTRFPAKSEDPAIPSKVKESRAARQQKMRSEGIACDARPKVLADLRGEDAKPG